MASTEQTPQASIKDRDRGTYKDVVFETRKSTQHGTQTSHVKSSFSMRGK